MDAAAGRPPVDFYDALRIVPEVIFGIDEAGQLQFANEAFEELTGIGQGESRGTNVELVAPGLLRLVRKLLESPGASRSALTPEPSLLTKSGERTRMEVSLTRLPAGSPLGAYFVIARDISMRLRLQERLEHLATHDSLTGLFNRRAFEDALQVQLARARRTSSPGAVLFFDVDHFKDINDLYGHSHGDELLVDMGKLLEAEMARDSIMARTGGDEFTCILPGIREQEAAEVCRHVLSAVREHQWLIDGQPIRMSVSLGVAAIPTRGYVTAEQVLARADIAMYRAKDRGRDAYAIFSAEVDWQAEVELRLSWRQRILDAIEQDRLPLSLQPILDICVGTVTQYEVLVRLDAGEAGVIDAAEFVPHAERFGLIEMIDQKTIREAIKLICAEEERGRQLVLHVNVSATAMEDESLIRLVSDAQAERPFNPNSLIFEVTESAAASDLERAKKFATRLASLGCRLALDDFGVGFSSFYHLKHLPVQLLKIDGSFVQDLTRGNVDWHLVASIVSAARALGLRTVCEYVGTATTLDLVRELGVDYAQGHYIGPARLAKDVLRDLKKPGRKAA